MRRQTTAAALAGYTFNKNGYRGDYATKGCFCYHWNPAATDQSHSSGCFYGLLTGADFSDVDISVDIKLWTTTWALAGSNDNILVSYYINSAWTPEETVNDGEITLGSLLSKTHHVSGLPTKVKLRISGTDDWNFWKASLTVHPGSLEFWLIDDGPESGGLTVDHPQYWLDDTASMTAEFDVSPGFEVLQESDLNWCE
jgi:hypothetical protein